MKTLLFLFVLTLNSCLVYHGYTKNQVIEFGENCYKMGVEDGYFKGYFDCANDDSSQIKLDELFNIKDFDI